MSTYKLNSADYLIIKAGEKNKKIIKKAAFEAFDESILGLGNIQTKSKQVHALSVLFDLEGFTNFCKQIDPHLTISDYLSEFLKWLFIEIKEVLTNEKYDEGYTTWSDLPFLSKYLGDGVLFLWDTEKMTDISIQNVVVSMYDICEKYKSEFLPRISRKIISPPWKLRCGIARGTIYSVGDGNDFVGPCINMSARLQKLHSLSFSFSRRGIDPDALDEDYKLYFIVKKVDIRGIGAEELVCILKDEYESLSESDKSHFS